MTAPPSPPFALPKCCANFDQIKTLDGQRVALEGTYTRVAIQKRRFSDEEKQRAANHAAKTVQILTGETSVMLEVYYRPEGTRSDEELHKFDQKRVRVVGKLIQAPPPQMHGDTPLQTMINPCLVDIESIELLD